MTRLLHLSDLHFGDGDLSLAEVLQGGVDKSLVGFLNRRLNPSRAFPGKLREEVLAMALDLKWDLLVITGDLTNLSHPKEFQAARRALQPLIDKGRLLVMPGNHDRYTKKARGLFEDHFGELQPPKSLVPGVLEEDLGEYRLFFLEQTRARPVHSAQGRNFFSFSAMLEYLEEVPQKRIFAGHYPAHLPGHVTEGPLHRLQDLKEFERFLLQAEAKAYLHGHIHQSYSHRPVKGEDLQVIDSGGCCRHRTGEKAGFHLLELGEAVAVTRIRVDEPQ